MSRILFFSRAYTSHDYRFLTALAKTGHQIFYLRLEGGEQIFEDRPLPPEIQQVPWAGGNRSATLQDGFRLLNDLHRVINQVKPDLIQAGPIQRSAFLAALTGFHPLVTMSWGYDLLHDAQINPLWQWATRYTLHHSDVMVGDCDTIRQLAIRYGMPDDRIIVFPWGIDLQHFTILPTPHSDAPTFSLLSTRNWEPIYGIDVLVRAFVIATKKIPELCLTLLGNGSQATSIRQILLIGAAYERVNFEGHVSYSALPTVYQNSDVYIGASHSDGTSISLLEALACGKPVIVPDIPGNREWIKPGENGWLFPDGDSEAMASVILNAYENRHQLSVMGQLNRQLAEQRADWDKNFQNLFQAYEIATNR